MPDIITNYQQFLETSQRLQGLVSLFWIVEYRPEEIGYTNTYDNAYLNSLDRFTLMRNECLNHPEDFMERLNNGQYRIWTSTPYNYPW